MPDPYRREEEGAHPAYAHDAYGSTIKRSPRQPLIRVEHTLSEITGPRFGRELIRPGYIDMTAAHNEHLHNQVLELLFKDPNVDAIIQILGPSAFHVQPQLAKEVATSGVLVNCVTPAVAKTELFSQMTEQHINYMLSKIPMNRFVAVEEIAAMVAWLSSEDCSFSTGAVFDISGGRAVY